MPRLTFKKEERLCSLKAIEELYSKGKSFHSGNLKVIFLTHQETSLPPCQVVFSVPKKLFKRAVDRNLLKRRMRESYRTNKPDFYNGIMEKKIYLHAMLLYTSKEILTFEEINKNTLLALTELVKRVV